MRPWHNDAKKKQQQQQHCAVICFSSFFLMCAPVLLFKERKINVPREWNAVTCIYLALGLLFPFVSCVSLSLYTNKPMQFFFMFYLMYCAVLCTMLSSAWLGLAWLCIQVVFRFLVSREEHARTKNEDRWASDYSNIASAKTTQQRLQKAQNSVG